MATSNDTSELASQLDEAVIQSLRRGGYGQLQEIADATVDELALISIEPRVARRIIDAARARLSDDWQANTQEPIQICPYTDTWARQFQNERQRLKRLRLLDTSVVEHVGSTAVAGLSAKPIIDIIVGTPGLDALNEYRAVLVAGGYTFEDLRDDWALFNRCAASCASGSRGRTCCPCVGHRPPPRHQAVRLC